jgi:phage gp36-like protein
MAYATLDDLKAQLDELTLIQLTDDEGAGSINQSRAERAIADAQVEIDGYLGGRYTLPLEDPVPESLRRLAVELAIYNLYARRGTVPEIRAERKKECVRFLEALGTGRISLGLDPEPAGGGQRVLTARCGEDRIFTISRPSADEAGSLDEF